MRGGEMPRAYEHEACESRWYEYWREQGLFDAEVDPARQPFCIVIPPPNVTGVLHMGHALDCSIQDLLTRWRRMQGREALWLPGTDHAGIATQNVVEALLAQEGITRHDLGREKFVERASNGSFTPFAVLKDGEWYSKGEVGWFGMSSDNVDPDTWNERVWELLRDLPEDTLITAVDCHI